MSATLASNPRIGRRPRVAAAGLLAVLLGVLLAACQDSPFVPPWTPPEPPPPVRPLIAFVGNRDGNPEIYTMRPDASEVRRLTDHPADDYAPAWSPGWRRLAFVSTRDGSAQIYVMDADGSNLSRLTNDAAGAGEPAWSPDGEWIAFVSTRDGNAEIYRMRPDGSGLERLTTSPGRDHHPSWSPDGRRIAFYSDRSGTSICTSSGCLPRNTQIHVMNADGSGVVRLTEPAATLEADSDPAWSPDGTRIAYLRGVRFGPSILQIQVMNADGSGITRLTNAEEGVSGPAWSPDGRSIVFAQGRDLFVMSAEGTGATRLTSTEPPSPFAYAVPAWSPAGGRIAFARLFPLLPTARPVEIHSVDPAGDQQQVLTGEPVGAPLWSPDGDRIAFVEGGVGSLVGGTISVMNADGSGRRNLATGNKPGWSPDGRKLVFEHAQDLYTINVDGTGLTRLTHDRGTYLLPDWSPDGRRIAFSRIPQDDPRLRLQVYVINVEGGEVTRLTPQPGLGESSCCARWSPDGSRLVLTSPTPSVVVSRNVYVMNADGSGEARQVHEATNVSPELYWSPDGNRIAFSAYAGVGRVSGIAQYYVGIVSANGSEMLNLTPAETSDVTPTWSPDGRRIAFVRDGAVYISSVDGSEQRPLVWRQPEMFNREPAW